MPTFPPQGTSGQAECADRFYAPILPAILELYQQRLSLHAIAEELERRKVPTRNLMRWSATQIGRVLDRAGVPRTKRPRSGKRSAARASGVTDAHVQQQQPADSAPAGQRAAAPMQMPSVPNARPPQPAPPAAPVPSAGSQAPTPVEPADIGRPQSQPHQQQDGPRVASPPAPRPVPIAASRIYLKVGGQSKGPFEESRVRAMLKAGAVCVSTFGRREGAEEWVQLGNLLG